MKQAIAERLPGCDRKTRGWESAAFVSLALVALVTIGYAVSGAVKFAAGQEQIVAALSARPMATAEATPPLNQCDCPRWCDEFTS